MSGVPRVSVGTVIRDMVPSLKDEWMDEANDRFNSENPELCRYADGLLTSLADDLESDDPKVPMREAWRLVVIVHELLRREAEAEAESEAVPA